MNALELAPIGSDLGSAVVTALLLGTVLAVSGLVVYVGNCVGRYRAVREREVDK